MHNRDPSPFCEAKGGRAERSETQEVHNPVPAKAGHLQNLGFPPLGGGNVRRTKGAHQFPSPSMGEGQSLPRTRSGGEGDQGDQGAGADAHPNLDVEAARKSMTRMANIFADIAKHAEDSSLTRCPYKDARSRCTAKFGCRNQHFTKNPLNPPICTAKDGDLDYRSAWEID